MFFMVLTTPSWPSCEFLQWGARIKGWKPGSRLREKQRRNGTRGRLTTCAVPRGSLGILRDDLCDPKKPRPTVDGERRGPGTLVLSVDPFRVNSKVSIQSASERKIEKTDGRELSEHFEQFALLKGEKNHGGKKEVELEFESLLIQLRASPPQSGCDSQRKWIYFPFIRSLQPPLEMSWPL